MLGRLGRSEKEQSQQLHCLKRGRDVRNCVECVWCVCVCADLLLQFIVWSLRKCYQGRHDNLKVSSQFLYRTFRKESLTHTTHTHTPRDRLQ